ncbi:MAG: hypothetical protein ABI461_21410 [Polyangiaceae bacterium]
MNHAKTVSFAASFVAIGFVVACGGKIAPVDGDNSSTNSTKPAPSGSSGSGSGSSGSGGTGSGSGGSTGSGGSSGGSTGTTSTTIACGTASCDATKEECCVDIGAGGGGGGGTGGEACTAIGKCTGFALSCTDASNCGSGQVCCATQNGQSASATCAATCGAGGGGQSVQLCASDKECGDGTCVDTPLGFKVCEPGDVGGSGGGGGGGGGRHRDAGR